MRDKLLVYISGPYTLGNPVLNTRRAIKVGLEIAKRGYAVFIPHCNLLWDLIDPASHEFYMEQDLAIVKRCDLIYRIKGKSKGADMEIDAARRLGIPAFFEEDNDLDLF